MWSSLNGTILNVATVLVGSSVGLTVGPRLPERYRLLILQALGLVTLTLGIDSGVIEFSTAVSKFREAVANSETYGARLAMTMIGCLLVGAVVGTALRIESRIEALGAMIHRQFAGTDSHRFAEGFLTASVLFCVGPLTLLGCLRNGAYGDPGFLYVKSTLDGFSSMMLASTLGFGVLASVLTVLVVQGALSLSATFLVAHLNELSLSLMTVVGGIILLATAMMILEIKKIAVANLLPGIFLPPLAVWLVEQAAPGTLLPVP